MNLFKRNLSRWSRWLHIYLSMFSFAALLFFAFTGVTLNHTSWIEGKQVVEQKQGKFPVAWTDTSLVTVKELQMVEYLRNNFNIKAGLAGFTTDETESSFSFKGPGYNADGFADRETGEFKLTITRSGIIAVLNDLHKGRDSGRAWSLLIDLSAVLLILISLSGFAMLLFLKKKRINGVLIALLGTGICLLIYLVFV